MGQEGAIQDRKDTHPWRPSRASLHFFSTIETIFIYRGAWKKAPRAHARNGLKGRTRPHKDPQLSTSVGKVEIGAPCLRIVRAETQIVPEHRQRTSKTRTSPMLLVRTNALRNARCAHRWSTFAPRGKRICKTTTDGLTGTGICSRMGRTGNKR